MSDLLIGYHPNPPRGCGGKAPDACYAEGGDFAEGGALLPWSWLLSDGYGEYLPLVVPPRQVLMVNPWASIALSGFIGDGWPYEIPADRQELYGALQAKTKRRGVADHVGAKFYTCHSFAREVRLYGPSRRITKDMARELAAVIFENGPVPMLFTHDRVPVFDSLEHTLAAIEVCYDALGLESGYAPGKSGTVATWMMDNWGQYASRNQWDGGGHFMTRVLQVVDGLDKHWKSHKGEPAWETARDFFSSVRFMEQAFGMSWLCRVSYTLDDDGKGDPDVMSEPGIQVIDLNAVEEGENE